MTRCCVPWNFARDGHEPTCRAQREQERRVNRLLAQVALDAPSRPIQLREVRAIERTGERS